MKGFLKSSFKWLAILLVGLPLSLYFILVIINLVDEDTSPLVLAFEQTLEQISQVPDEDNAFIYFMGIEAPEKADFLAIGQKKTKLLSQNITTNALGDSANNLIVPSLQFSDDLFGCDIANAVETRCSETLSQNLEAINRLLADTKTLRSRYEKLTQLPAWYEVLSKEASVTNIMQLSTLVNLNHLAMLELWLEATPDKAQHVKDRFEQQGKFLRMQLANSHLLLTKMVALEVYQQFLQWFEFIVIDKKLPKQSFASIQSIQQPLSKGERSMELVAKGELDFFQRMVNKGFFLEQSKGDFVGRLGYQSLFLIFNEQATYNLYAEFLHANSQQTVASTHVDILKQQCEWSLSNAVLWYSYNPLGKIMTCATIASDDMSNGYFTSYFDRITKAETARVTLVDDMLRP
ncbi:hypothetical protein [Colwellia sp. RSH04]|uniref:hypothetical protein n=1 Tax=Colwellia sp. RSH04 TaxID=2305464 RepID=UPI000E56D8E7|nr:hypothetical protein [Colwellia sp. RSH04]RHW77763.1 hypothetical protein D1094_02180 [Colwellia sp. RSH04]